MQVQLKGQVVFKSEVSVLSDKFSKQSVWIKEVEGEYPQTLEIQAINKRIDLLQTVNLNDVIIVDCNVNGKLVSTKNGDRVFNSLDIWKVAKDGSVQPPQPSVPSGRVDTLANPIVESFEPPF